MHQICSYSVSWLSFYCHGKRQAWPKWLKRGKGLSSSHVLITSLREQKSGTQRRCLEAGTEAESVEECWLAPRFFQLVFLCKPGPTCLKVALQGSGGPSTSIINWEDVPQTCLPANQTEAFSQLSFPLPKWLWLVSGWQKLTSTSWKKRKIYSLSS